MTEHKAVDPLEDEDESAFLLYLTNGNVEHAERLREMTSEYKFTMADLEPNTITIPTTEYEQLKADAERYISMRAYCVTKGCLPEAVLKVLRDNRATFNEFDEAIDQARDKA